MKENKTLKYLMNTLIDPSLLALTDEYSNNDRRHIEQVPQTKIVIPLNATPIPKGATKKRLTKAQRKKINTRRIGNKK